MTADLPGFLLARIAEDEVAARDAGSGPWSWKQGYGEMCNEPECPFGSLIQERPFGSLILMEVHGYDTTEGWEGAEHIARWDPARVLAECEAKRRIVEHMRYEIDPGLVLDADQPLPHHTVLRLLALPYADHPDYRQEWRP